MPHIPRYQLDSLLSGILVLTLAAHYAHLLSRWDTVILLSVATIGVLPVFWSAFVALREREWASMDMLASIALAFSLFAAQWASAIFITLMLAAARILSSLTKERTERSITGLLKLRPETAKAERSGKLEVIPVGDIKTGDILVVDLGERMPIDGIVIGGEAAIDESSLTGESLPVEKSVGTKVFSSTLVVNGNMRVRAERVGKDTTLERIIALVESARAEKPKTQTLGERFGKAYLLLMFAGSLLILAVTRDMALVLSIVLVVCADDIAVAIPIAYLRALGAAAKRGVIIKGARHLETLGNAKIIVFDKTGTLTKGAIAITAVIAADGRDEKSVLEAGSLAAKRSPHPVSRALVAYAAERGIHSTEPESVEEVGGSGIIASAQGHTTMVGRDSFYELRGIAIPDVLREKAGAHSREGRSISYIARDAAVIGFVAASDSVKDNARQAIRELKLLGFKKIVMLTGDNASVARNIAREISIEDVRASLLPEHKVAAVRELCREGITVMVGDGVNDAAALSAAHVGIAMGAMGVDGAIESAEIVLMKDDLMTIAETVRLARQVTQVSMQDFWIWGVTNAAGLALVFAGFIGPSGAAAYNFISDFFPLMNSGRIRARD